MTHISSKERKTPFGNNISQVMKLLKQPMSKLEHLAVENIYPVAVDADILTVHLYSQFLFKRRDVKDSDSLLKINNTGANQLYFFRKDDKIYYEQKYGSGSGSREKHNQLIDIFYKHPELREKTKTAVIVTMRDFLLAYYFHQGYSFVNNVVGENYRSGFREEIEREKMPFSYLSGYFSDDKPKRTKITFQDKNKETLIYHATTDDFTDEKFRKMIEGQKQLRT